MYKKAPATEESQRKRQEEEEAEERGKERTAPGSEDES